MISIMVSQKRLRAIPYQSNLCNQLNKKSSFDSRCDTKEKNRLLRKKDKIRRQSVQPTHYLAPHGVFDQGTNFRIDFLRALRSYQTELAWRGMHLPAVCFSFLF